MFCKAEIKSVRLLQEAFDKFSAVSGLQANPDKISIYMSGVKPQLKQELGYGEGKWTFRYLGVSLSSKKLTVGQCLPLVERITGKISCWIAKLLSYASRVQLIKAVLFNIQIFWAQIFVLSKKILKMIEAISRTFLWTGSTEVSQKSLVFWDNICIPLGAGGLNIQNMRLWNKETILKLLWAVTEKKDSLWIKWVQEYYLKTEGAETCTIPANATWVVRKILAARTYIIQCLSLQGDLATKLHEMVVNDKFNIKKVYTQFLPQYQKVETLDHLYFGCKVTHSLWQKLLKWLSIQRTLGGWTKEIQWASNWAKKKSAMGVIISCVFGMLVAIIWRERNHLRFQTSIFNAEKLFKEIAVHIHITGRRKPKWQALLLQLNNVP
ncbi:uncharacterized protein LOC124885695 [Capsicum annuum]|uniref:uncharacterized protein LOC124885695 n=1 Tax=Capsicum annuum TaxID=4072 RepID=UPI001FB055CE|nr:uncharacterized protein LOC124885695 [Capsicum annuum]